MARASPCRRAPPPRFAASPTSASRRAPGLPARGSGNSSLRGSSRALCISRPCMDEPSYERFDTGAGYQAAVERMFAQPGRELRVFDPDGASLRLNDPARIEVIEAFLTASRVRRLYMVVHRTDHIT